MTYAQAIKMVEAVSRKQGTIRGQEAIEIWKALHKVNTDCWQYHWIETQMRIEREGEGSA